VATILHGLSDLDHEGLLVQSVSSIPSSLNYDPKVRGWPQILAFMQSYSIPYCDVSRLSGSDVLRLLDTVQSRSFLVTWLWASIELEPQSDMRATQFAPSLEGPMWTNRFAYYCSRRRPAACEEAVRALWPSPSVAPDSPDEASDR
jgi:hypothetical protein